ncbi:MAG: hypothetical protein Q9210_007095 [Variospora velana]
MMDNGESNNVISTLSFAAGLQFRAYSSLQQQQFKEMCRVDLLVYGCGHEQFWRLARPCPAHLCQSHNQCHANQTRTRRRRRVRQPPFCMQCYDEAMAEIIDAYNAAIDDIDRTSDLVRHYLEAIHGRGATIEDAELIDGRLEKSMMIAQELLQLDFYGPSRRAPVGSSAFLYERPPTSIRSPHDCIRESNIANDCDSSQNGDDEGDSLDEEDQEIVRQVAIHISRAADNEIDIETREEGDYFRQWR